MRVLITYDLEAGEGTDPGPDQDVAHPVPVVVHPRDAGERGPGVEDRADTPARARPEARRLARHRGRRGECRRRVSGGKRTEVVALETATELVAAGIARQHRGPLPADERLDHAAHRLADDERLRPVQ